MMFKIIDKLSVAVRKRDNCGYAIPCENTHTEKYKNDILKIKKWASPTQGHDGSNIETLEIDNVPVKGFKLSSSFKRMGYFGSGNAIFRIADPRGFELELYQESFAKMLTDVTMINGEIQNECYWSKSGSMWVLIPVDSDEHKKYVAEKSVHVLKSLKPSEVAKLPHGTKIKYKHNNSIIEAFYYGVVHAINLKPEYGTRQVSPYVHRVKGHIKYSQCYKVGFKKRHLIRRVGGNIATYDNGYALEATLDVVDYVLPDIVDQSIVDDYAKINISTLSKSGMYKDNEEGYEKHSYSPFCFSKFNFITKHKLTKDNVTIEMVDIDKLPTHFAAMVKKQKAAFIRTHEKGDDILTSLYMRLDGLKVDGLNIAYDKYEYTKDRRTNKPELNDAYLIDSYESSVTQVLCVVHDEVIIPIQYSWY